MRGNSVPIIRSIAFLCLLAWLAGNPVMADQPDAAKPGGAQAGQQFNAPIPPNMRRFLVKPPAESTEKQKTGALNTPDATRLSVSKIQLAGVVDRPEQDIFRKELETFVEQKRQAMLVINDQNVTADTTLAKNARIRKQAETTNSLSLHQLQEIAAQVAQYYRDRGFILVRVVIPPQTILQGVVSLRILEGVLGNISLEKNQHYHREQMLRPFEGLLGKPVIKKDIEAAMLALNDYPGLTTFAVFRPGLHPGETDLLVSVIDEKNMGSRVHVDNYGSEFTGEFRTRLDVHWNNPLNAIDRLSVSLSKTIDPNNGVYAAVNYERHAFGPNNIFGIGASKNNYSLGAELEPFGIKGTTTLAQVYWRHAFQRSRLLNSYALFQLSRKSAKLNVTEGEDRADELTVASIETGFDWASSTRRHLISGRIQYSEGFDGLLGAMEPTSDPAQTDASRRGGSLVYAGGKFSKTNLDVDHWYQLTSIHTLHFSLRAQDSGDLLTSLEQMPIGGPNSVRAYSTSEFLRDKGASGSVEWLLRAPGFSQWKAFGNKRWGEILQFVFFVDYAKGWLNDPLVSDREVVSLSGAGAGVRFHYEQFSARFEVASALGDEPVGNKRDPQYFFELNFLF